MKQHFYLLTAIAITLAVFNSCNNKQAEPKLESTITEGREGKDHMQEAIRFEIERTKDPALGYVPRERLLAAFEHVSMMSRNARVQGAIPGITWNERGPSNVGGRTRSIVVDKNDPTGNTVWAGSVGGGLWKATNYTTAGYAWNAVNNLFPNLAVTTIAQNPVNTNTMYFGTGEGYYNVDALQGDGIFKSTDGGVTWNKLPFTNVTSPTSIFAFIQKIVVKQVGPVEYVFAATQTGGVQRSIDGGATFTQVLTSVSSLDAAADIEISANGDIYASLGVTIGSDGIYKSTDNGTTWTKLLVGLPPIGTYARIELACAPSDNNVVYASFQNMATNDCLGIWKTTTAGLAWLPVTNPNDVDGTNWTSVQAWYDMIMCVDPDDANHVVIGGLDTWVTTDGGTTFTKMSSWYGGPPQYIHADHHAIQFHKTPGGQKYLYFGNDGGMFFSANASAAIPPTVEKNNGYNVTQFYHGAIGPVPAANQFIAGAQDNGTQYFTAAGVNATTEVTGGDGAFCHIDEDNPNIQTSQYVYNYYFITNNNWASYTSVQIGSSSGVFINPSDYDSRTNSLYGSNAAGTYSLIKNVGTSNDASTRSSNTLGTTATISAVTVSPNTVSRVFFGTSGGRIVRVDNADGTTPTFTNLTPSIPVAGNVSEISVEEGNDNHIIYCVSNYGVNSIWETTDGTTWHSIEGDFSLDVPVRAIMFAPNDATKALIGTDVGVYSTDLLNGATTNWGETNSGLAHVSVQYLDYRKGQGTMIAVTHGRGVYTSSSLEVPAVYFGANNQQAGESSTLANGCRKYTDITVPVTLSATPSGPVDVNVTVNALSSATEAKDFQIVTPMPLIFATASTQNIVVRVYDDPVVEGTERAVLEISITNSGATNAKKGAGYLDYITIVDNDKSPEASGASVSVFTENWESGAGTWSGFNSGSTSAPNAWKISNACDNKITNQTAIIYNQPANTCGYDNTKISTATIYRTVDATGKSNLSLSFDWIGVGEVGFDEGQAVFDTSGLPIPTWVPINGAMNLSGKPGVSRITVALPSQLNNRSFKLGFQWNNDNNTGTSPAFGVDNIELTSTLAAAIQLNVNAASVPTHYVGGNETVHFYDNSGNIMATIKNNSSFAIGCVTLEVDRAGGGANVPFWSNSANTYLCAKTFKVLAPDAPFTGVNYDISLYYTKAEIDTWKAGTGYQDTDAKMVKITGHTISEVTPTNQLNSSVTIAPASRAFYAQDNYVYTATFNSFSGFGLGAPVPPVLPVTLLNFSGTFEKDKAVLLWKTSMEIQNKGFYLERSTDGNNFSPITFVNGHGTSMFSHNYSYNDYDLTSATVYYYRLKQENYDGRYSYSNVVRIDINREIPVHVFPNPFYDDVRINFGEPVREAVVELIDASGVLMYKRTVSLNNASSVKIDFGNKLAKGSYMMRVNYNDKKAVMKIVKR